MSINPILMEGGGQALERRFGWLRSSESVESGAGKAVRDGTFTKAEEATGFDLADQLSKGLVGRVLTPERQEKIDLAQGAQIADRAMEAIEERLQQARADLTEIHKMFPPYPHGSQERADFLNSFKSLRMQIDKLVFPPESDIAAQILGGIPADDAPPETGQFPVNSGPGGLELLQPDKPVDELEDAELPAIIKDLERASGVLYERRMSLEASVGKMFNQEAGEEVFTRMSIEVQEKFAAFDISIGRPKTGVHQDLPFLE
jgi:hypothetical protein